MAQLATSTASETSTVKWDHEPFDVFKHRVKDLCEIIWPAPSTKIAIQWMHGGASNRVIGITITSLDLDAPQEYVLRIPRFREARIQSELAILLFLQSTTKLPVPSVLMWSLSTGNPIDTIYNIQLKLPGVRLFDVYRELPQVEQLSIVSQLAQTLTEIHKITSYTPGMLDADSEANWNPRPNLKVVNFLSKVFEGQMVDDVAEPISNFQLLIDLFDAWEVSGRCFGQDEVELELFGQLRLIAWRMDWCGLLGGDTFTLHHPDFSPQNILVNKEENSSRWKISGVVDWEYTIFAPYAVACCPPTWIWSDWGADDRNETDLCKTPDDPESRERKALFDSLMDRSYTKFAYSTQYRLFRQLFRVATGGMTYSDEVEDAKRLIELCEEHIHTVGGGQLYEPSSKIGNEL